jgi:hypothetical protein
MHIEMCFTVVDNNEVFLCHTEIFCRMYLFKTVVWTRIIFFLQPPDFTAWQRLVCLANIKLNWKTLKWMHWEVVSLCLANYMFRIRSRQTNDNRIWCWWTTITVIRWIILWLVSHWRIPYFMQIVGVTLSIFFKKRSAYKKIVQKCKYS